MDALKERKLRAILIVVMVMIGGSLVTALNAMGDGMNEFFINQYSTLGANVIVGYPKSWGGGNHGGSSGGGSSFRINEPVKQVIKRIPNVKEAIPFIQQSATVEAGGQVKTMNVIGIDQTRLTMVYPTLKVAEGKLIEPQNGIGMLLGQNAANPPDKPIPFAKNGQAVSVKYNKPDGLRMITSSRSFRVEGVLEYLGTSGFFPVDKMVAVSLPAANALFKRDGNYDAIFIVVNSLDDIDGVVTEVHRLYGQDIETFSAKSALVMIKRAVGSFQLFLGAIAAVSLAVAGVGIFAGMYTSVADRTKEIGLLKALGFKNKAVLLLFLSEAMLVGIIGGAIGNLVGIGVSYLFTSYVSSAPWGEGGRTLGSFNPVFTAEMLVAVWFFCVFVSIAAGVYPAWRAARMDPVVALRKE